MNYARGEHSGSLLTNGNVLVVGRHGNGRIQNSAQLHDQSTETWTMTGTMNNGRYQHTTSVLTNGKVLVIGGNSITAVLLRV
jgi:hypothetical protein